MAARDCYCFVMKVINVLSEIFVRSNSSESLKVVFGFHLQET
jgi:hypothetical protein